jgi:hypothetical protein
MKLLDVEIKCSGRGDRGEIFPLWDIHCGKYNCNELALKKEVAEIKKRDEMEGRHVRVLLGGDVLNAVNPNDVRRFDFSDMADWLLAGNVADVKDKLSNMTTQEADRLAEILAPIRHLIIGALEGGHEKTIRKRVNQDIQTELCSKLDIPDLSDEVLIRFRFVRGDGKNSSVVTVVARHGYGSGRSAGAEPMKLKAMLDEWICADVCISGHTHTFCVLPPQPAASVPTRGELPAELLWRHRFALNPGCWLDSHSIGRGTYESNSCYPARAFMTAKIVIWPFYEQRIGDKGYVSPKIEIRSYPIL